ADNLRRTLHQPIIEQRPSCAFLVRIPGLALDEGREPGFQQLQPLADAFVVGNRHVSLADARSSGTGSSRKIRSLLLRVMPPDRNPWFVTAIHARVVLQ